MDNSRGDELTLRVMEVFDAQEIFPPSGELLLNTNLVDECEMDRIDLEEVFLLLEEEFEENGLSISRVESDVFNTPQDLIDYLRPLVS